jgi:two-component system osmolarity sensor histidine kinase EnvZ
MHFFQPKKYFWKILTTIGVVSIVFQLITISTLAYFMLVPLGQRAADDLANVMVHAAETWQALPVSERPAFAVKMKNQHELQINDAQTPLAVSTSLLPYLYFLENSLQKQMGREIPLKQSMEDGGDKWFWADIPIADSMVRLGFARSRLGVNPPIAFLLLISIGLYLTIITAVKLTGRLTVPIERLHQAAQALGNGQWPDPIKIEGPEELSVLAREFNRMNIQVRELLSNRTTLLAGIAHDLRTPLTQIQLALAMLPDEGGDPALMKSIQNDLDAINHLIGETLSISLELEEEEEVRTDVAQELKQIIDKTQTNGLEIQFSPGEPCRQRLHPLALRRIFTNLLVNALRYGGGESIEVLYHCNRDKIIIQILDQGPGIPSEFSEAVFRPFYRLEKSRGSGTGGSGLGLAIVQQLCNAQGWDISLQPRRGGGTVAVLRLNRQ